MTPYTYTPLDSEREETRFLRLLPGSFSDEVRIEIFHCWFDENSVISDSETASSSGFETESESDSTRDDSIIHSDFVAENDSFSEHSEHSNLQESVARVEGGITSGRQIIKAEVSELENDTHPPFDGMYEALSYTWGSSEHPQTISVSTKVANQAHGSSLDVSFQRDDILSVSRNLYVALKHLRRPHGDRILWIDAICINQSDVDERSVEVSRMGNIYKRASQVIVWLGPEEDDSELAMELIRAIGSDLIMLNVYLGSSRYHTLDVQLYWETHTKKRNWDAFLKLLERPWFTRLWVFQEVQLAVSGIVVIGFQEAPLHHLALAATRLVAVLLNNLVGGLIPFDPTKISNKMDLLWPVKRNNLPHRLITMTRSLSCLDPRDRVYGILSLLPSSFVFTHRPDYTLEVEEVYQEFFLSQLSSYNQISFDQVTGNGSSSLSSIKVPSWVPDLAWHGGAFPSSNVVSSSHDIMHSKMEDSLNIPGVQFDRVGFVGQAVPLAATEDEMVRIVRTWEHLVTCDIYHQDQSRAQEDLRETLDKFLTAITCQIHEAVSEDLMPIETWLNKRFIDYTACVNNTSSNSYCSPILHRMYYYLPGRTFFTTEKGLMGLGPASMIVGDIVCVGLGCSDLLILHPINGKDRYTIRGDACVPGLMFGEKLLGPVVQKSEAIQYEMKGITYDFTASIYTVGDKRTQVDPRLGSIPAPWRMVFQFGEKIQEDEFDDEKKRGLMIFQNMENGKIQRADPRLTSAGLKAIGVNVQDFVVI